MLKFLNSDQSTFFSKLEKILNKRSTQNFNNPRLVKKIISDVKKNKDQAIIKYEKKFSKLKQINTSNLRFSEKEINRTIKLLDKKTKNSIDLAFRRIYKFHKPQKLKSYKIKDNQNNYFSYKSSPIEKVGVYVPGGPQVIQALFL